MGMIDKNDHTYSFSQLSLFHECRFAYYLSHIEKVEQAENAFAQYGTLMHSCLERWADGLIKPEELHYVWETEYADSVTQPWPRFLKNYDTKAYELGVEYLKNFDCFKGFTVLGAEEKYTTFIEGRRFIGIVDLVLYDESTKELVVVDHKSKALRAFKQAADDMYKQLYLYSKFISEQYGQFPDRLRFNLFKENIFDERPFDMKIYEQTLTWAVETMEKIESLDILDWLTPKEEGGFYCENLCSVRNECPNGAARARRKL